MNPFTANFFANNKKEGNSNESYLPTKAFAENECNFF